MNLLFQSTGGSVSDGIFLHNLFKSLPMKLTLYNAVVLGQDSGFMLDDRGGHRSEVRGDERLGRRESSV
jgi:hypothetical protein